MTDEKKTPDTPALAPAGGVPAPLATWGALAVETEENSAGNLDDVPQEIMERGDAVEIARWQAEHAPPLNSVQQQGVRGVRVDSAATAREHVLEGGDPSVDKRLVEHVATVIHVDRIGEAVVVHHAAEAASAAAKGDHPLLIETMWGALGELKRAGGLARLLFLSNNFERLAWWALVNFPREGRLTAVSEREFYLDGRPVAVGSIDSHIRRTLVALRLYNNDKRAEVTPDRKMIGEVRAALAQMIHEMPEPVPEPEPGMRTIEGVALPAAAEPGVADVFALVAGSFSTNKDIRAAWIKHLGRDMTPAEDGKFFKALLAWAGARVQPGQLHGGARGYHGLRIK